MKERERRVAVFGGISAVLGEDQLVAVAAGGNEHLRERRVGVQFGQHLDLGLVRIGAKPALIAQQPADRLGIGVDHGGSPSSSSDSCIQKNPYGASVRRYGS